MAKKKKKKNFSPYLKRTDNCTTALLENKNRSCYLHLLIDWRDASLGVNVVDHVLQ